MSAGDRPDLPLTSEPAIVLRTAVVGEPAPGPVQPVDHHLGLEEEPALRFEAGGPAGGQDGGGVPPERHADSTAPGSDQMMPTTGPRVSVVAALGSMGLAWILRRRVNHSNAPGSAGG